MKKLLFIGLMLIMAMGLWAQEIVYTNQVTIEWDVVAPMGGDTISYEVYRAPHPAGSPEELLGETTDLFYTVTFTVEGTYILGVRTVRTIIETGERLYSDINWSDVNGVFTPNPFLCRYYQSPVVPEGLRLQ